MKREEPVREPNHDIPIGWEYNSAPVRGPNANIIEEWEPSNAAKAIIPNS